MSIVINDPPINFWKTFRPLQTRLHMHITFLIISERALSLHHLTQVISSSLRTLLRLMPFLQWRHLSNYLSLPHSVMIRCGSHCTMKPQGNSARLVTEVREMFAACPTAVNFLFQFTRILVYCKEPPTQSPLTIGRVLAIFLPEDDGYHW